MIIKNRNKGFILVMTLVMAVIMLVIAFVCLKIFLAPYIAIQSDIIKKKEFYMADTAIEVIREQISNLFYDIDDSKGPIKWENLDDKYSFKCLYLQFPDEKKELRDKLGVEVGQDELSTNSSHQNDIEKFIAKYSGNILDENMKNTLPSTATVLSIGISSVSLWQDSDWNKWYNDKPLGGLEQKNTTNFREKFLDEKVSVKACIKPVKITNDINITISNANADGSFYYKYKNGKFVEKTDSDISNSKCYLPKELQKYDNFNLQGNGNPMIIDRIKRRDYVIIATATYTGSDIQCHMKYYFSLISIAPDYGDSLDEWGAGKIEESISNSREIRYRLYFRKLEYDWTEG